MWGKKTHNKLCPQWYRKLVNLRWVNYVMIQKQLTQINNPLQKQLIKLFHDSGLPNNFNHYGNKEFTNYQRVSLIIFQMDFRIHLLPFEFNMFNFLKGNWRDRELKILCTPQLAVAQKAIREIPLSKTFSKTWKFLGQKFLEPPKKFL